MTDLVGLTRSLDVWAQEPLTWFPVHSGDRMTAEVVCGTGHAGLIDEHDIDEHGRVTPSVVCTDCDWHEFIVLEGWPP